MGAAAAEEVPWMRYCLLEGVESNEKAGKESGDGGGRRSHVLTKHGTEGMAGPCGMEEWRCWMGHAAWRCLLAEWSEMGTGSAGIWGRET